MAVYYTLTLINNSTSVVSLDGGGHFKHNVRIKVSAQDRYDLSLFDAQFNKGFLHEVVFKMNQGLLTAELDGTPTNPSQVNELIYRSAGGVVNFTDLSDVPSSYTGHAGESLRVNVGETGLEFFVPGGGSILFGAGNPNGVVAGNRGQTYQDTITRLFYRCDANVSTVWSLV